MLDKVLSWLSVVELSRLRRLSSFFRDTVDRPATWEAQAAFASLPPGTCRSLASLLSLRARATRFAGFGTELSLPSQQQPSTEPLLFQSVLPLLPSHLSPATCFFELEASGPGLAGLRGAVGVAARGSIDVRGLPFGGEHFFSDATTHPSDSSPLSRGGTRGIGLEWPTKQLFLVEAGQVLFFESVAELLPHPAVELYATLRIDAPPTAPVKFSFNFGARKFVFDIDAHLEARAPEIEQLLRLKEKYALPIIRCSLCSIQVPISEDGIVEPHNCVAALPPTPKKDDAGCILS